MSSKLFNTTNSKLAFMASVLMMGALFLSAWAPVSIFTPAAAEAAAPKAISAPVQQQSATPIAEPTINVATDPKLGEILVGDKGMTLYAFSNDKPNQSNCTGVCLTYWPALLTLGKPTLGKGVDASLVGTATLADGSKIVTYNKMPLYYFVKDTKAGDTSGEGFQNLWYVVSPAGKTVNLGSSTGENPAPAATVAPAVTSAPGPMTTTVPLTTTAPLTTTTITEPSISVATAPKLGKFLVGDKGMTLYIFKKDGPNKSNCTAACLQKWHPLLTLGAPTLGKGVNAALIGTATLSDGSKVVTYNKMPLYYFVGDSKAGDTKGEGVGGFWFVISPLGKLIPLPVIATPKSSYGGGGGGGMGGGGGHY